MRRAGLAATVVIKAQRAAAMSAGCVGFGAPVARRVIVASGAAAVVPDGKTRNGRRVVRPAARRVILPRQGLVGTGAGFTPAARQWAQATEQRAAAVATARAAQAELLRAQSQRLADFEAGTRGLRSGWLSD